MAKDNIIVSVSKSYSGALCQMCSKGAMKMEGECSAALCPKGRKSRKKREKIKKEGKEEKRRRKGRKGKEEGVQDENQ